MSTAAPRPMRVVMAPDSLTGSATAVEAAEALRRGWLRARPSDDVALAPMADGGQGTLDVLASAVPGARRVPVRVTGPDDRPVDAHWLRLPDGTGVIEVASTSGITLLDPLRPLAAHTRGFGQAIRAALDAGVPRLLLALGGSSSTDGGVGALRELGARFRGVDGSAAGDGGGAIAGIASADLTGLRSLPAGGARILGDVRAPLTGPAGAAAVYGPQKGATPDDVRLLDAGLAHLARLLGVDPETPGSGAAGGTAAGLLAWGAEASSGSGGVADAIGLAALVADADVVVTGEGRFDAQSRTGKVASRVLDLATAHGTAAVLVAGSVGAATDGFHAVRSLTDLAGSAADARAHVHRWLERAAEDVARDAEALLPRAGG
ncbi:Glycerate 2-kinase [Clavibacter michiganensis]|uniref:Glycerate 2-kinase n=1 Tax=Clavibacter michiganensis TaxID=28447 RepID=A0A251Y478_9MICO|nr:glycerate kinase [Clavibacter michiganensis]OUE19082.1 Glycerate 2-kinase [Clavibacter michiganensis]